MARRKEFEPDVALEKAMRFFWQKGYQGSSIRDLIANTGVNFYGLYSVFGDKHGIYVKSLEMYITTYSKKIKQQAELQTSLPEILRAIFKTALDIASKENEFAGCMICNAAIEVAPNDPEIAKRIKLHRQNIEKLFFKYLSTYQPNASNEVTNKLVDLAEYFTSQIYNIGLLIRSGNSRALVERHIETTLKLIN
jgi:TetR/AcrR family transcriptional repressor of nem operon